jgi:hypothetical protein
VITFDEARRLAASSPEVLQWFQPGCVEIAEWGHANSRDFILAGRSPGEPWWHELPDPPIPGPPMIVVSKANGAVRTFVGAMVPDYFRETGDEQLSPVGDVPHELNE